MRLFHGQLLLIETYMRAEVPAERAHVMSLQPLDVVGAEQLLRALLRAPVDELLDLVGASDAAAAHGLHALADGGHARLLLSLFQVLDAGGAGAHEWLNDNGRLFRRLLLWRDRLTLPQPWERGRGSCSSLSGSSTGAVYVCLPEAK